MLVIPESFLKTEVKLFPLCAFTWKLELVSNTLRVIVVKGFDFLDKKPGLLELFEVWLNLDIRSCIAWLVLPNYKKN